MRVRNLKRKQVWLIEASGATAAHAAHNCKNPGSSPGGSTRKRMVGARRNARREDLFFVSPGGGTYIYARARAFAELVKREGLEPRREKA